MTVQSAVNSGITHSGNGSATYFSFPFKVNLNTQIEVIVRDADDVETTKSLNTDYTVSNHNIEGSGTISYPVSGDPLPTGHKITITPKMDYLQSTDLRNQGRFAPESHEDAFDTVMMHIKELKGLIDRCIKFKKSSEITESEFDTDPQDGYLLAWDGATGKIKSVTSAGTATVTSFMATLLDDTTASEGRTTLGLVIGTDIQSYHANLAALAGVTGATNKIPYFSTSSAISLADLFSNRNLAINGQGIVAQLGTTFNSGTTPANNDDTYLLDQMILLSDGNDIVDVSQDKTEKPTGSYSSIKFDIETANKQFAYFQPIEAIESNLVIGGKASLSFKALKGSSNATLETLRAAIISWDGTADSITSDVIGTWAGGGTNPALATNWTYESTPSDLTLTSSWQEFKINNVDIDTSSAKNVGILIWCDDTDATVGDLAYIGDIKLEAGSICTPFIARPYQYEVILCELFYEKSYESGETPGTATIEGLIKTGGLCNGTTAIGNNGTSVMFKTSKRSDPTIITYDTSGTAGKLLYAKLGSPAASVNSAVSFASQWNFTIGTTSATGLTGGHIAEMIFHYSADSRL